MGVQIILYLASGPVQNLSKSRSCWRRGGFCNLTNKRI